jgi:hypothetical protein
MPGSFVPMQFDDMAIPDVICIASMTGDRFLEEDG